jgi:integrase
MSGLILVLLPQCFPNPLEATLKLDSKAVNALRLDGKTDQIFFEDTLSGFGYRLRLGADGKINASWIAQYRRAGSTRRVLIGAAAKISAEQARKAARKILGAVALGHDPQADRIDRRAKDQHSVRSVVAEYLAAKQPEVRERTLVETTRYLTDKYFKPLHAMPIDTVSRKDVAACVVRIQRECGASTAARARATVSSFFSWAMQMGYAVAINPVIGTVQPKEQPRTRVLSDSELAAVWRACDGNGDYDRIVRLLILTGCRRQEVGGMRWNEFTDSKWTIPGERSKNKHEHTLPLPSLAWNIINAVPRAAGRDHLFGVWADYGFSDWGAKVDLDAKLGSAVGSWTIHDLRRTVATRMADLGIQPHVIEQILNHRSGHKAGVAGIYNRSSYEREVRAALALWADYVTALIEGRKSRVVPLKTA